MIFEFIAIVVGFTVFNSYIFFSFCLSARLHKLITLIFAMDKLHLDS